MTLPLTFDTVPTYVNNTPTLSTTLDTTHCICAMETTRKQFCGCIFRKIAMQLAVLSNLNTTHSKHNYSSYNSGFVDTLATQILKGSSDGL